MALTVKLLKGMGIEEDKVEAIIAAHTETIDGLKAARDKAQEEAKKVPDLQRKLEEAKAASEGTDEWEQKYEKEHQAFEDYKAQIATERSDAEKAQAYRGMLMAAGIDPKRIDSIMRVTDLSEVEMEDGKLKEQGKLEESAKQEWADFVVRSKVLRADPAEPPKQSKLPEGADPEIAKYMQARHERQFGKTETKE
jgi:hypothetical protein